RRHARGRPLRPPLGTVSRRPRAHGGLRGAGERALGAAPALRAPRTRALGGGLRAPPRLPRRGRDRGRGLPAPRPRAPDERSSRPRGRGRLRRRVRRRRPRARAAGRGGRARALAVGLLAVQGSMALGSLLWGVVATHSDIPTALVAAAAMLLVGALASRRFALHGLSNLDLRPDPRWSLPETACQLDGDEGPVLVTLEYDVDPDQAEEFLRAVRRLEPVRRRDGAIRWSVYRDTEDPRRWLEVFVVE